MKGFTGWIDDARDLRREESLFEMMTKAARYRRTDDVFTQVERGAALGRIGTDSARRENCERSVDILHSGTIYNRSCLIREIEARGGALEDDALETVLLRAYQLWGRTFVLRLDGMFAIAIWDRRARTLHLVRDHLGIKPLYYHTYPGGILFSTKPAGIFANPLFEKRLDFQKLSILFQPRHALPGETPLVGLHEVARGTLMSIHGSRQNATVYWRFESEPHHDGFDATARRLRDFVTRAVGKQMPQPSEREAVGSMLSGGLDSTTVTAVARNLMSDSGDTRRIDSFCVEFPQIGERYVPSALRPDEDAPFAANAAAALDCRHHRVAISPQEILDKVDATRLARDLPGWGQFDASTMILFERMRQSCEVALTGEIADEILGGYPYFFDAELIRRENFPWLENGPQATWFLSQEVKERFDPEEDVRTRYRTWRDMTPKLEGEDHEAARMREIFFLTMSGRLAVLLDRMDRMSAVADLEMRLPFCDREMQQYLWNVPWSFKSRGGVKGLLKAAVGDIVPDLNLTRKKSAFPHIQSNAYDAALVGEALGMLDDSAAPIRDLIDRPALREFLDDVRGGKVATNDAHMLIHLIEANHWLRTYGVALT